MTADNLTYPKIACIGEVMMELVSLPNGDTKLGVAGDTYNTAVYLARALQGFGALIAYVTALGTDPYSERIMQELANHGLASNWVERRETRLPGIYAVHTNDIGERSFSYWRENAAARTLLQEPCEVTFDRLSSFDLIYLSGISVAILPEDIRAALLDWIDGYRSAGGTIAFDSNYRPRLWASEDIARDTTRAFWSHTDIALPSVDDEMELFGDAGPDAVVARLKSFGVRSGAMKRGAEGPLNLATGETPSGLPIVEKVVDTTAAGDSFNAGYLGALALGQPDEAALRAGHILASQVIRHRGAIIPTAA
ncbi:MAG: sugar kinase [Pseudomonadota bacterium]